MGEDAFTILDDAAEVKRRKYAALAAMIKRVHPGAEVVVEPLIFSSIGFTPPATMRTLGLYCRTVGEVRRVTELITVDIIRFAHRMFVQRCRFVSKGGRAAAELAAAQEEQ